MKQAIIPYIPLDGASLQELIYRLETEGKRLSIDMLNWAQTFPYAPICHATLAWSDRGLIVHYYVRGLDLRTLSAGDGNYVHEDSCVEIFIQRERGDAYINYEYNAAGVCYASHHSSPQESIGFTPEEYATIQRWSTYQGAKVEEANTIYSWELCTLIPWTSMGYPEGEVPTELYANLYKCGDGTAHPHYLSWAPIQEAKPAFHRPQYFGTLVLERPLKQEHIK